MEKLFGGIEAGGTKFVCAAGNHELEIIEKVSYPTTNPEETMTLVIDFFKRYEDQLVSIGIGSFGPIDIHRDSKTYGYIISTPKLAWQNFDFIGTIKKVFDLPIVWTTDVNAACYGEYVRGNGKGVNSVVYYTIGTGIGGGALQNGIFVEGFSHPEMGHILVSRNSKDAFEGNCPFHRNCLEGMASGPAIEKRLGQKGQNLNEDDPFWKIEADYIAQCAYNTTLMFSPDVIIFGGGVMQQEHLVEKVRHRFKELVNNYVKVPDLEKYIVTPKLQNSAGIIGCIALAKETLKNQ